MKHRTVHPRYIQCRSLPYGERGLKLVLAVVLGNRLCVAPLRGAWIETGQLYQTGESGGSLPYGERGLKQGTPAQQTSNGQVAPLRGAWIETPEAVPTIRLVFVAPLRGAWIETNGIRMKGLPYATILVEVAEML